MRRTLWTLSLLLVAAGLAVGTGCTVYRSDVVYAHPEPVIVSVAPPPPRVEVRGVAPAPNYVWIEGSWSWRNDQWVWVEGRWVPPRAGYTWVAPRVERYGEAYRYNPGYWRPESPTATPVRGTSPPPPTVVTGVPVTSARPATPATPATPPVVRPTAPATP
ncbi:MAG: BcpO-related WXXGXW repeat protein, partial [Myxococcales bacterium]|nr:BcpO-related WXXGXW repeat protein [Myxococcales bacterium]